MLKQLTFVLPILALAACQTTTMSKEPAKDPLVMALSGKTLTTQDGREIHLNANGSISGIVEGAWMVKDGMYCRTLTKAPEGLMGTACQNVTIDGDQAKFERPDGSASIFTIS